MLTAVFIPMAFFAGSVGVIYRQFSVTIASAMLLSVLVAIILTPALCAVMLKPTHGGLGQKLFGWFNRGFDKATGGYVFSVGGILRRPLRVLVIFAVLLGGAYWLYTKLPTSFLPEEDQGVLMTQITLPAGANAARTQAVIDMVENYYLTQEKDAVQSVFMTLGFGFSGSGENAAMGFIRLKDFDLRTGDPKLAAKAVAARASAYFSKIRDAQVFVLAPPAIQGLGQSSGFSMYLEDTGNTGRDALTAASNTLADESAKTTEIANVRGNTRTLESQLKVSIDQEKAGALGIELSAINSIISTAFSGNYVNDFVLNGEIKPVYVQADAQYRMQPGDIERWFARNSKGEMVPFCLCDRGMDPRLTVAGAVQRHGCHFHERFGRPGRQFRRRHGPHDRTGGGLAGRLYVVLGWAVLPGTAGGFAGDTAVCVSLLVVFLCLAALYESWSIPFSILFAVPVGVFGALLAATLFGQSNDVYFKVGLLTTIGLTAKNAILIVEFAKDLMAQGRSEVDAVLEAARLRLRPIVMTSLAFILGVTPLAIATGAGSAAQKAIGIGVMGGMLAATLLGIFIVPLLFVMVMKLAGRFRKTSVAST